MTVPPASLDTGTDEHLGAARAALYGFLALLIAYAALGAENWPLTGWRLFSHVRTGEASGWQVDWVDAAGAEHAVDWSELPRTYSGWFQIAGRVPGMSDPERLELCSVWAGALRDAGHPPSALRVYRTRQPVRTDYDRPPPPLERTLVFDCAVTDL